jgi:60 kDa SS-A/Ro ribonucleoprotein
LETVKQLVDQVDSQFLAKLAVYSAKEGHMKDMPAFLLAVLVARKETKLVGQIFHRICARTKVMLNFVQIVRSGVLGRKSFGSSAKNLLRDWIKSRSAKALFDASIGHSNPSLADVIRMVHPRPDSTGEQAIFSYITGLRKANGEIPFYEDCLPPDVQAFEKLKAGKTAEVPNVPFQALSSLKLSANQWRQIGRRMPWNTLRMNLNTLHRNGVFDSSEFVDEVASKLRDEKEVDNSNAFPYQLLTTFQNTEELPPKIRLALQDAMEIATRKVPKLSGKTVIAIDVSGSMMSSVTGNRPGSTSKTTCVDVAALIAACVLRTNEDAVVIAFDTSVKPTSINPRDSVMTNASKLAISGGGTDCTKPFDYVLKHRIPCDNFILVSDNQSWSGLSWNAQNVMSCWQKIKAQNKKAKLLNIDLQPYVSTITKQTDGQVFNIGGWSDACFTMMAKFFNEEWSGDFADIIEKSVELV